MRNLLFAVLALLGCLPLASAEIPIDGQVRGPAGIQVELRPILSSYEQGVRELEGRAVEPAAQTVTGAGGLFRLTAPGEGMWEVVVLADGFVPQRFRLTPLTEAETLPSAELRPDAGARAVGRAERGEEPGWEPLPRIATSGPRVEVPATAPLPGRVIDTYTRQPIAGAWVWPRNDPGRFVRTDERGSYRLEASGVLMAAAAGYVPEVIDEEVTWPKGSLPPIALDPAVVLVGTVVDREGRPAAGAEVSLLPWDRSWLPHLSWPVPARAGRVSPQGEVRISGLRPGIEYDLVAGGGCWRVGPLNARENRFRLALDRGCPPPLWYPGTAGEVREVALHDQVEAVGASLSGRLLGRDGLPVSGALILLEAVQNRGSSHVSESAVSRTDGDGNYRLTFSKAGLRIVESSYGVFRHGRLLVVPVYHSEWKGPEVLPTDGRLDLTVGRFPEPLEALATVEPRVP